MSSVRKRQLKINERRGEMSEQERLDVINLHIYLGEKQGLDVAYLIWLKQQRYLKGWDVYEW